MNWPDSRRFAASLTFDGAYRETVATVTPILDRLGLGVTWYVVAGSVGGNLEGRAVATWDELRRLTPRHEIGNHTLTHPHLAPGARRRAGSMLSPTLNARRVRRILERRPRATTPGHGPVNRRADLDTLVGDAAAGKQVLEWQLDGVEVRTYAHPGGRHSHTCDRAIIALGHEVLRTSEPRINVPAETDLQSVGAYTWRHDTTAAEAESWATEARERHGWLVEVFHEVAERSSYPWSVTPDTFERHLAQLVAAGAWIAPVLQVGRVLRAGQPS